MISLKNVLLLDFLTKKTSQTARNRLQQSALTDFALKQHVARWFSLFWCVMLRYETTRVLSRLVPFQFQTRCFQTRRIRKRRDQSQKETTDSSRLKRGIILPHTFCDTTRRRVRVRIKKRDFSTRCKRQPPDVKKTGRTWRVKARNFEIVSRNARVSAFPRQRATNTAGALAAG